MTRFPLSRADIETAFLAACHAELQALKPGNVHIHRGGHGMEIGHFERAAVAAAPFIADPSLSVGERILGAVEASFAATGLNTNLGIVLLAAPLAAAAGARGGGGEDLALRLADSLDALDQHDAEAAFRAIMIANPAGLGRVDEGDVSTLPAMTLKQAMALAAGRDRIARAYITGFEDIFAFGLPELQAARRAAANEGLAITALHMSFLASFPDSHVARKHGVPVAEALRDEIARSEALWRPAPAPDAWPALIELDASLKARGLNPGTTADFVVATLFADALIEQSATAGHG